MMQFMVKAELTKADAESITVRSTALICRKVSKFLLMFTFCCTGCGLALEKEWNELDFDVAGL